MPKAKDRKWGQENLTPSLSNDITLSWGMLSENSEVRERHPADVTIKSLVLKPKSPKKHLDQKILSNSREIQSH